MNKKNKLNFFNVNNSLIELKKRIFFVITSIIIFRIGSFIPIPGINSSVLSDFLRDQKGTIIDMFNMFSGGALSRASIFSLGIMPYISSSIIIQLLTLFNSRLSELQKEGELGKNIINQYTRYITFLLSILQAIGIASTLPNISGMKGLVPNPNFLFYFIAVLSLVTGTMLLMWLGELITERGIGNGISIIIFVGIISGLPSVFCNFFEEIRQQKLNFLILFYIFIIVFFVTFLVIFIERSYRKIFLHYPKQNKHYNIYTTQSTHLPLKVNMSGIMPAIFSSSIIMFPVTLLSWINIDNKYIWLTKIIFYLQPGNLLYIIIYSGLIIFFCFFYSNLMFNPRETAEKLKKSGAFIHGIRPGEQTAKYISNIMYKLIFIGSLYIIIICLIPDLMKIFLFVPFYFGGTSLLIVVLVIIDFIMQIQTLMMSSQYHSILKKNNFNFKIMH